MQNQQLSCTVSPFFFSTLYCCELVFIKLTRVLFFGKGKLFGVLCFDREFVFTNLVLLKLQGCFFGGVKSGNYHKTQALLTIYFILLQETWLNIWSRRRTWRSVSSWACQWRWMTRRYRNMVRYTGIYLHTFYKKMYPIKLMPLLLLFFF